MTEQLEKVLATRAKKGTDPSSCRVYYTQEEVELQKVCDRFRTMASRVATFSDVLAILKGMGYVRPDQK
jgi:Cdc6-like AAA superfamily ATPase